jgi:tetratricopeptide (TPR) repeat protein
MALSEIEKLERRYAENPQGLTFAPLAEIHRKNGEVQRALDLLGSGLKIHPDYIPASIVLGRCHMDLGDVPAAEAAFLHVLALDGENVIALKALADISERLVKFDDAERWLHTLLTVDRSNDDAREQLQRVEIARRQAEVASSAEPAAVAGAPVDVPPESGTAAVAESASPPPFEPPVAEPAVGWVSQSGQGQPAPPIAMDDVEPSAVESLNDGPATSRLEEPILEEPILEEPILEEPILEESILEESILEESILEESIRIDDVEPIDGLVGRETETAERAEEFRVETSEDIILQSAGGSEFQMPDASQELFAGGARGERAPFEEDAPVPPMAARNETEEAEAAEPYRWRFASKPPTPTDEPRSSVPAPEPVAADTELVAAQEAVPAPEPLAAPAQAAPRRSYGATDTGGRPITQVFKAILAARPPAQAAAPAVRPSAGSSSGAPTRPAADALSLSSVFGEEASATPPAVPAPGPASGAVSFDDFFGSPSGASSARTPRAADSKNDDLDQFHTWLQNLKR